jgi:hypothetical protein
MQIRKMEKVKRSYPEDSTEQKMQKRKKWEYWCLRRGKNGADAIFEEIKAKQILILVKYTDSLIQEAQMTKPG